MPSPIIRGFLDAREVTYQTIPHPESFTAQETAAVAHVPGMELAKTVIVKLDGKLAMVVVPATCHLDLGSVCESTGAQEAELAEEDEFRFLFPDCELGAMPPLGNLYDVQVYVCKGLARAEAICFNAGSHKQLVRVPYAEFVQLVKPTLINGACGDDSPRCQPRSS